MFTCMCLFIAFFDEISFLGYTVSQQGIRPREIRIEAIRNFSRPRTHKELIETLSRHAELLPQAHLQSPRSLGVAEQIDLHIRIYNEITVTEKK